MRATSSQTGSFIRVVHRWRFLIVAAIAVISIGVIGEMGKGVGFRNTVALSLRRIAWVWPACVYLLTALGLGAFQRAGLGVPSGRRDRAREAALGRAEMLTMSHGVGEEGRLQGTRGGRGRLSM